MKEEEFLSADERALYVRELATRWARGLVSDALAVRRLKLMSMDERFDFIRIAEESRQMILQAIDMPEIAHDGAALPPLPAEAEVSPDVRLERVSAPASETATDRIVYVRKRAISRTSRVADRKRSRLVVPTPSVPGAHHYAVMVRTRSGRDVQHVVTADTAELAVSKVRRAYPGCSTKEVWRVLRDTKGSHQGRRDTMLASA